MIKLSHGGINLVEKPVEISGVPRIQFLFAQEGSSPDRYSRVRIFA